MASNRKVPKSILVTGAGGQLGRAVVAAAEARGMKVHGRTHKDLAVEDAAACAAAVTETSPNIVVHCAAWTNVDACEEDPDRADEVNAEGTGHLAYEATSAGAVFVYVSTDFVFAGDGDRPYAPDDTPQPLSAYGHSKLRGEEAVLCAPGEAQRFVVRTSWVFGPGGKNFPAAILNKAREGGPLSVVDDQTGSPTYTVDLAEALLDLATTPEAESGVYHASNDGHCTWHEFAVAIVAGAGLDVEVGTMSSDELDRPAPRPAWSVLDCDKLTAIRGASLPTWEDALDRYLKAEQQ